MPPMSPSSQPVASQSRAIVSLSALYIFRMLGLFMVLPVLALSEEDYIGGNIFLLGIALGIYGLTQALLQIPFGLLSDRFGRKPLILIGLLLFALGSWVSASSESITGLIIGRALQGAGAIAGVIMAMVSDLTSEENRSKAMASIGASIGVAFALALIVGPLISSLSISILGDDVTGVRLLFWSTVFLSLLGIMILLFFIPSTASAQQKVSQLTLGHLTSVIKNSQCVLLYSGVFVLHYVLMAFFVVVPLLLEQAAVPRESHSWIYLGVMLCSFVVMVPLLILGEKKQKAKLLIRSSVLLLVLTMIMIVFLGDHSLWLVICLGLFFIAFNFLEASFPSLLTKILPPESKGAGSGMFATCQFLGAALGGILSGALYSQFGLFTVLSSAVVLLLVWFFLSVALIIPKPIRRA